MILYHGSNIEIRHIDLNKSARGKDFGKGFYLSEDEKTMSSIEYMNECMARDLAVMLVEDYRISIPEALDILYNSETYEKLQDPRTGLYFQSPVYVYDFLLQELKNGKLA